MDSSSTSVAAVRKLLVAAAALAAGCFVALSSAGDAAAAGAPDHSPRANGVGAPIAWRPCDPRGPQLQCATIRVPLDWDRRNGRTIRLALIRHLASKPEERIGTLFINPGGPGDSGVHLVSGDPEGVDALGGGRFDVVSWDPRGTNASSAVRCFKSTRSDQRFWAGASMPTTIAQARRSERRGAAVARRCGKISGWLLPHISTADTARDLNHLRALMGERTLTFVGLSYGSYIGETYANMFPHRVRAILLNGLVDPVRYSKSAEARLTMWTDAVDEVFRRFLSLCQAAGPERCALAGRTQTANQRWRRLVARVKRHPIPAPGAARQMLSRHRLTYSDLLISQFQPMRSPSMWPDDAVDLDAALRGDGSALEESAGFFVSPPGWGTATVSSAIQCADGPARKPPRAWPQEFRRLTRNSPLSGGTHFAWEWTTCANWPVRGQDAYRGPWNARTPNPILVMNQRYDPNGWYVNAVRAAKLLGNAVLLTHEGYGHLYFQDPSACMNKAILDYLTRLVTPPKGTVCQSDHQPFDPDFGG